MRHRRGGPTRQDGGFRVYGKKKPPTDQLELGAPPEPASRRRTRAQAVEVRDEGMARAEDGAGGWSDVALEWLRAHCRHHPTLCSDDLWNSGMPEPREPRALGPVLMRAVRLGLIRNSGDYIKGKRSGMAARTVWESLIYQGGPK